MLEESYIMELYRTFIPRICYDFSKKINKPLSTCHRISMIENEPDDCDLVVFSKSNDNF